MRIVIPDDYPPVYQGHPELARLIRMGESVCYSTRAADRDELLGRLRGAPIAINVRAYTIFDDALLAELPDLRLVSILGTGTDNVDLGAASARGVVVTNTPGASTDSVAELTWALVLATARHIVVLDRRLRAGEWYHRRGTELRGKTLGVVGLGAIGQEVARMGRAFGMHVLGWSYTTDAARAASCGAQLVDLDDLLRHSDVVSVHVRASSRSAGLIGARELALMKPTAILVNTARGVLVDEAALAEALRAGRLAGAGLDVYSSEPLPAGNPLRDLENVILTPHVGWVTNEAVDRQARMPVDNIVSYLEGHPEHVVNPEALRHPRQTT